MIKLICGSILMISAFVAFLVWATGSNGHLQLRANMLEDWIFAGFILSAFVCSVLLFIYWRLERKTKR
jgi:hypothetical protein